MAARDARPELPQGSCTCRPPALTALLLVIQALPAPHRSTLFHTVSKRVRIQGMMPSPLPHPSAGAAPRCSAPLSDRASRSRISSFPPHISPRLWRTARPGVSVTRSSKRISCLGRMSFTRISDSLGQPRPALIPWGLAPGLRGTARTARGGARPHALTPSRPRHQHRARFNLRVKRIHSPGNEAQRNT